MTESRLKEESEELEKDPELLSVKPPSESERWLKPETQKVLEPREKPELELDLLLPGKDWPELKPAPRQVNMLEPQQSSSQEHVKKQESTIESDQVSEVGTELEQ